MKPKYVFLSMAGAAVLLAGFQYWRTIAHPRPSSVDSSVAVAEPASGNTNASATDAEKFLEPLPGEPARTTVPYVPNLMLGDRSVALKDRIPELLEVAKGDPSTAYDLGTSIGSCVGMAPDDGAIESMLDQGGSAVRTAEAVLDQQEYCVGLSKDDFDTGLDLLNRAANSGLLVAQENYAYSAGAILATMDEYAFDSDLIARFKVDAINHLQRAATAGSNTALANLAHLYEQGTVAPVNPELALRYYEIYLKRSGNNTHLSQVRLAELKKMVAEGKK